MDAMTPKERFLRALYRQRVDRIPVGNPTSVATVESMEACGAYFPEVHLDPEKMARLAATGYELLGFDTIAPYFSVVQEVAAFGLKINWGTLDTMPDVLENPFGDPEEIKVPTDFLDRPPVRTVLKALKILKREYGDYVCLIGKVMGPWTLSYHLHGVQNFLIKTILEPDKVHRFLARLKEVSVMFANAQLKAGADVITVADHATGDLVSGTCYRDFLLPVHQEITRQIEGPTILHICGNTIDRLEYVVLAGFSGFHFDSKVNPRRAHEIVAGRISLIGNVNNPVTLLEGTPEDVRREVFAICEAGIEIIAPECAVPLRTPNTNLKAIVEAVVEYCRVA
ncbi:[methyl-Co(III) methanol-specific corrinoid protein]:coenzyme M methyltransferase [Thermanaeromonas toyohensis ToBE]|uniref:[methyl-Co(III) methanol-specific corrinoid protein]:coenzyme M methyltransferase n=1 Tax=Thermanaeromonas toyohensis ToBE TaxID=698762 RepID=A0A1W1W0A1_9FIRM|nr:MtaA/CmuA family methyltransferase [Thermanaeromonas toyohensis]SMB99062.1 [methyl-Co(III) methanol-specific corrinoid protein]:coenzyme M methyltransferase [Thermanaeromonas toyohensis ToBE]